GSTGHPGPPPTADPIRELYAGVDRIGDELVKIAGADARTRESASAEESGVESAARACRVASRPVECAPARSPPPGPPQGCPLGRRRCPDRASPRFRLRRGTASARGWNADRGRRCRGAERG